MTTRPTRRRLLLALVLAGLGIGMAPLAARAQSTAAKKASPTRSVLIVANKADHTVSLVDPVAGRQIAIVPTGGITGHEVATSPDGRLAYVPIYGDSGVGLPGSNGREMAVLDVASRRVVGHVDFGRGVRPHCAIYDVHRNLLYVTTELDDSVSIVDPRTLRVVGSIPTGQPESHMLALSHDGLRGYTANVGPGTVSVLDMQNRTTVAILPVAPTIQRISISPDDSMVFTSDQTRPRLAVLDTATHTVRRWVPLPSPGYGSASTPDGRWLLVALPASNQVAVIDLHTLRVAHVLDVCASPQEILIPSRLPDTAYVSCMAAASVAVLDLSGWKMQRTIAVGRDADGLAWADLQK